MSAILEGWIMYFFYLWGFINDHNITKQVEHRKSKCEKCPLKKGGWCSKKNSIEKIVHSKKPYSSVKSERKTISGCGCFLKAKYFSSFNKTKCPLKKWQY